MRRAIVILSVLIMCVVPFLSACESGELQELVYWAKLWAIVHDITDEDGTPNIGAATRFTIGEAFGLGSTGDEEGDAAIDCGRTLNNIREAADEADEGWTNLYKGANVNLDVLPHYNQAVNLRPKDWRYRNERGIAQLENADSPDATKAAQADFDKADELAHVKPSEYLKMLKHRAEAMEKIVEHDYEVHAVPSKYLLEEQSRTYNELATATGDSKYTLLKQQVDSRIKEGYYWTSGPASK